MSRAVSPLIRSSNFIAGSSFGSCCTSLLLKASRRDVGQLLIAEALAVPFKCSTHVARRRRNRGVTTKGSRIIAGLVQRTRIRGQSRATVSMPALT
jgi:hypothetical protein